MWPQEVDYTRTREIELSHRRAILTHPYQTGPVKTSQHGLNNILNERLPAIIGIVVPSGFTRTEKTHTASTVMLGMVALLSRVMVTRKRCLSPTTQMYRCCVDENVAKMWHRRKNGFCSAEPKPSRPVQVEPRESRPDGESPTLLSNPLKTVFCFLFGTYTQHHRWWGDTPDKASPKISLRTLG